MSEHDKTPPRLLLATSNPGKVAEFRLLASSFAGPGKALPVDILADFDSLPGFAEDAPTFAENAAGKALHYSRFSAGCVLADDSGLVVPALGGAPGVQSARYAGPDATNEQRITKLLAALRGKTDLERRAYFVCVLCVALRGRVLTVISSSAHGRILESPRGTDGFGYDPVFYFAELDKTFAEMSREEKNCHSHRGKAFRKLLAALQ